ncbi:hypothetical protein AMATHDRAFT_54766 [Amanita thiersii Skay4041]|uniref:G-protein coupled receptors family 1 profile domain-containing protein n=1 Tax=Amanita thiersii Skay4041 TaxID=703135 RepID=A0A2A9NZY0_9AGAR|nr:hypothetical protein AMATHDRAFT_54766 [Amanita thiersii Skay4041]
MASKELLLGPLLLGALANTFLYGVELVQVYAYLQESKRISVRLLRIATLTAFLNDTLCSLVVCVYAYMYAITFWGDTQLLRTEQWPAVVITITTNISIDIAQLSLLYSYWIMSEKIESAQSQDGTSLHQPLDKLYRYGKYVLAGIVALSILFALVCLTGITIDFVRHRRVIGQRPRPDFTTLWLATCVTAFIIIFVMCIWQTRELKELNGRTGRPSLVYPSYVIIANLIPTASLIMTFVLYMLNTTSRLYVTTLLILGRVCSCMMLLMLHKYVEREVCWTDPQNLPKLGSVDAFKLMNLGNEGPGGVHNIEPSGFSTEVDGQDSIFSHATSLSDLEISRRVQDLGMEI